MKKKKKFKKVKSLVILLVIGLLVIAYTEPAFFESRIVWLCLRAILIIMFWYTILMPALLWVLEKWAAKQKKALHLELQIILDLIPELQQDIARLWQGSNQFKFFQRLLYMIKATALVFTSPFYQQGRKAS